MNDRMDKSAALTAFAALSQEVRLDLFRKLIEAGQDGMLSGEVGEALGLKQNTASANLSILLNAGLIRNSRDGRNVRYFADLDGVGGLLAYLMEDCCGGRPEICQPAIDAIGFGGESAE